MEPKLLTAQEAYDLVRMNTADMLTFLEKRGLIADEPIDPLADIAAKHGGGASNLISIRADVYRADLAEAYRRGMELASAKELTRERLREAVDEIPYWVFEGDPKRGIADRLHAALVERMK